MEIYWNREHNVDNCSIIKIIYLMIIKRIVHVFQLLSREYANGLRSYLVEFRLGTNERCTIVISPSIVVCVCFVLHNAILLQACSATTIHRRGVHPSLNKTFYNKIHLQFKYNIIDMIYLSKLFSIYQWTFGVATLHRFSHKCFIIVIELTTNNYAGIV